MLGSGSKVGTLKLCYNYATVQQFHNKRHERYWHSDTIDINKYYIVMKVDVL